MTKTVKNVRESFDYTSIKTFEDASKKQGIEPQLPEIMAVHTEAIKSMIAYYKLVIIFLAINNGWTPVWSNSNQYKYFPYFWVLSSGFGFGGSGYVYVRSHSGAGSRLCTDTREKALYIAEQFKDIYQEYLLYSE